MAAAMVDRQGRPLFASPSCTACGLILEHLADRGSNRCSLCETVFCTSCFSLKQTIESSSADGSYGKYCAACEQVIAIKKGSKSRTNINYMPQERPEFPAKPPRRSRGKPLNLQNDLYTGTETFKNGGYSSSKNVRNFPFRPSSAGDNPLKTYSSVTQSREEPNFINKRFRGKRNERGLASKSRVSNVIDNRYYYLNGSGKFQGDRSNLMINAGRRNVFAGVSADSSETQVSHANIKSSKVDRQHEIRPIVDNNDNFDWDRKFDEGALNDRSGIYPHRKQSYKHTDQFEPGMPTGSAHIHQRNNQTYNTPDQFPKEGSNMNTQGLPPYSQFYAKTIKYPTSSVAYPFSRKSQTSNTRYSGQHRSDGYKGHSGFNELYDDPLFDAEDDLDDLEDVPAYDDIPYALIITESVDAKTILRARRKQQQQLAFDIIKGQSGKTKAGEKINKNKNQGLNVPKDRDNRPDTYREQMHANRNKQYLDTVQNALKTNANGKYVADNLRKEVSPNENTDYSTRNSDLQFFDGANGQDVKSSDDGKLSQSQNDRHSVVTLEGELVDISGKDKETERAQSPVDISHKETVLRQTPKEALTSREPNKDSNANKNVEKEFTELQPRTVGETEKFIREKRLEKLKSGVSEFSDTKGELDWTLKRKPDNRDVAVNMDAKHKPVKSTAFRSKMPDFFSNQTMNQKPTYGLETREHEFSAGISDSAGAKSGQGISKTGNQSNLCSSPDQQQKTMKPMKKEADTNHRQKQIYGTYPQSGNNTSDKQTNSIGTLKESVKPNTGREKEPSTTTEEVPSVMKLLRKREKKEQTKTGSNVEKAQPSDNSDDDELVEPAAMRLLRRSKEAKESQMAIKGAFSKSGTSSSAAVFSFLSTVLGMDPYDTTPENYSAVSRNSMPTDRLKPATTPKQKNKNKNKNVTPLKQKGKAFTGAEEENIDRTLDRFAAHNLDKKSDTGMEKKNESQLLLLTDTGHAYRFKFIQIADNRHRAFRKLKMSESEDRLKCTSCGRPECKSHNIQKMKEIIRMAKQAGFEVRDVTPDGNCMFAAVVDQLQLYGDFGFGPKSLREAAVSWLIEHPFSEDGTHYSSFVPEEWDVYLQRMMAEGEWGDHLILRAVVETVGHTIKILNISGDESHWTILEPETIDTSKDGMHLVLGHVGEFHYTSLRPADGKGTFVPASPISPGVQDPLMAETGQIALEGTETVEMFNEGYVDSWSDMPTVHFSYLLKHIIPVKVVDTAAIMQSQFIDNVTSGNLEYAVNGMQLETIKECGGSAGEGVYCPGLHVVVSEDSSIKDRNIFVVYGIMKDYHVVEKKSEVEPSERSECVLDTTGVHAGYTKLLKTQRFSDSREEFSMYQPHIKILASSDEDRTSTKSVMALKCLFWPECALSWKSRVRREGFPSRDIISSIESEGCLLVPNPHKFSRSPDIEWQFSFSLCEKKLFRDAVSIYQKYCYILFDALCKQTMCHLESISSEHLKSVFFYACERIPTEYWESSPGACVLYMLDELLRNVRNKNLPNYFVHANNMVDHLTEKDFKEIEEQIILLRSQPVLFLRQINESLKMLPHGNSVIDKVTDDTPAFKAHRSLKRSTLEVFVPVTIGVAHDYIKKRKYAEGYEILSQAFQERLSVSTCDDSVPFQIFLPGAVSGLDLDSLVWFSAYTDRQLEGQLSKSLIRETCGDLSLVKIKDILPADVVGSYGNTEVPGEFSHRLCSFCYDFARFLYQTSKLSEILPILYHCHAIFSKMSENANFYRAADGSKRNGEQPEINDFDDESMFKIYSAMFHVYRKQGQMEFFRSMMPVVDALAGRIRTRWAYNCLCYMYKGLNDRNNLEKNRHIYDRLPDDPMKQRHVTEFYAWVEPVVYYS